MTIAAEPVARLWSTTSGEPLHEFHRDADWLINAGTFSGDGAVIFTGAHSGLCRGWRASDGANTLELRGHEDAILEMALSPDGTRLLTISADSTARIWSATTGQQEVVLAGHEAGVCCCAYSPDGRHILTGSWDKAARLWDAATGACLAVFADHQEQPTCVRFSGDGREIATVGLDATIALRSIGDVCASDSQQSHWQPLCRRKENMMGKSAIASIALLATVSLALAGRQPAQDACHRSAAVPRTEARVNIPLGIPFQRIDAARAIPACLAALVTSPSDPQIQFELGRALHAGGSLNAARFAYLLAATRGHALAENNLAGLAGDLSEARALYERAAAKGLPIAQRELGLLLATGMTERERVAQNALRVAAEGGEATAAFKRATFLRSRNTSDSDVATGFGFIRTASANGDVIATRELGGFYLLGRGGIERDPAEAARLFRSAAERGDMRAQINLGALYQFGIGVERDVDEAARWLNRASDAGSAEARARLREMME